MNMDPIQKLFNLNTWKREKSQSEHQHAVFTDNENMLVLSSHMNKY